MTPSVSVQSLPAILPVFPLTGVFVLPGAILPLHVFEARYRNLVQDALNADGNFGMIQPIVPQHDNRPLPGAEHDKPELYRVGCAGHIERWERLPDGRYLLQLRGVNRFRFECELPLHRSYRRVKAIYQDFPESTLAEGWACDRDAVLRAVREYGKTQGIEVRLDKAKDFSDVELVNILAMSLPFHPAEKQALLEARALKDREMVLLNLLRLGTGPSEDNSEVPSRTLN